MTQNGAQSCFPAPGLIWYKSVFTLRSQIEMQVAHDHLCFSAMQVTQTMHSCVVLISTILLGYLGSSWSASDYDNTRPDGTLFWCPWATIKYGRVLTLTAKLQDFLISAHSMYILPNKFSTILKALIDRTLKTDNIYRRWSYDRICNYFSFPRILVNLDTSIVFEKLYSEYSILRKASNMNTLRW